MPSGESPKNALLSHNLTRECCDGALKTGELRPWAGHVVNGGLDLQASFLSYGLNGVPLDAGSAGTDNLGPADGAGLAVLSPPVKQALTTIFADDLAQLK